MVEIPKDLQAIAEYSSTLSFFLNGKKVVLDASLVDPQSTLLDFIRTQRSLTGTKLGCGEGGCGACTVVIQRKHPGTGKVQHDAVNACLAPLAMVDGKHVITIEALGTVENPHPLQQRLAALHGSQCGFCTPGIVMSIYALLRNSMYEKGFSLSAEEIELEGVLDGNLCRCTGYKPILDAAKSFVTDYVQGKLTDSISIDDLALPANLKAANIDVPRPPDDFSGVASAQVLNGTALHDVDGPKAPDGLLDHDATDHTKIKAGVGKTNSGNAKNGCGRTDCCKLNGSVKTDKPLPIFPVFDFKPYKPGIELIYPAALNSHKYEALAFGNDFRLWLRPVTLDQLVQMKNAYPKAKIVSGSSEVQIEIKFKAAPYNVCIYVADIPELTGYERPAADANYFTFGANLPLFELETLCKDLYKELGPQKASALNAIQHQLRYFAGRQVRNVASASGNLATASPISDLNPVLLATKATLVAQSADKGEFELPMTEFFLGYRKTALPENAVLTKIKVPLNQSKTEQQVVRAYKQAKRRDDDISIVTACLSVVLGDDGIVKDCGLVYGGMAAITVEAKAASKALIGQPFAKKETLESVLAALEVDFNLPYNVPGDMATFRRTLTLSFFYKFWHEVMVELELKSDSMPPQIDDITQQIHRKLTSGVNDNSAPYAQEVVGKQMPHYSGGKHVTGEAIYIDDMPKYHNELYGWMVLSDRAHAKILEVDTSVALEMEGVHGWVDHTDMPRPEDNYWGLPGGKEPFLAVDEVMTAGIPLGLILAETKFQAQAAARAVIVRYETLPAILSMEEAIEAESYFPYNKVIGTGSDKDIDAELEKCDHVFEGMARMGGQEHFYLETNASIVVPKLEDGEMEIYSSTQNLTELQEYVAQVTGVDSNKLVCRVKRLGGGFGGKETRSCQLGCILAMGAKKYRRPVRCMLDRDADMVTTGQRHPFLCHWKVGTDKNGKLHALKAKVYCNGGHSLDISAGVIDRALGHIENAYFIPHVFAHGKICKTNTMSNTAFRGFGGPQGMFIAESYIETIAHELGKSVDEIRSINLYKDGDKTHYQQTITDYHVPRMYNELATEGKHEQRRQEVDAFNKEHKWRKRGLSLLPTKFGISFGVKHFNQGSALVHIYKDGSVLVAHGGHEMGQGLYTKCCQIAAQELGIPFDTVFTSDSATNLVPNTSATAASTGSDLNGYAVKNACAELKERLAPYRERYGPDATLKDIAHAAWMDRVHLSATGHYITPKIGYVWQNYGDPPRVGQPDDLYFYYTTGIALAEVEVDMLTGDSTVLQVDLRMDVGKSLNPAIDIGQITGAFVQGQGLFTMEESLWLRHNGTLFTRGPGAYKIPGFSDIPQTFNTSLLRDASWPDLGTIHSSKGVGEPPLFLGCSVYLAMRDALKSARADNGVTEIQPFISPLTSERIRCSVADPILKRSTVEQKEGEHGFFVRI